MSKHSPSYLRQSMPLTDEVLPIYDVSDELAVVVDGDAASTWSASMAADLIEVDGRRPLGETLGARRALPRVAAELLHGERPSATPARLGLSELVGLPAGDDGWILLGRREQEEIALGWWEVLATRYRSTRIWMPARSRHSPNRGYAKTVYALAARSIAANPTQARDADCEHG